MIYLYVMLGIGVAIMLYRRTTGASTYFDTPIEAYDGAARREQIS